MSSLNIPTRPYRTEAPALPKVSTRQELQTGKIQVQNA